MCVGVEVVGVFSWGGALSWTPIELPDRQLTMPRPLGGHKEPQRHRQPPPNLLLRDIFKRTPLTLFFLLHYPAPAPIMHHLFSSVSQEKGRPFVASHSVTQTQDRRLPATKWSLSLGLSRRSLCSCRLGGRGRNVKRLQTATRRPALHERHN